MEIVLQEQFFENCNVHKAVLPLDMLFLGLFSEILLLEVRFFYYFFLFHLKIYQLFPFLKFHFLLFFLSILQF